MTEPAYLSIPEVAAHLRVSYGTAWRLVTNRELGSIRVGRRRMVPTVELARYLDRVYIAAACDDDAGEVAYITEARRR